MPRGKYVVIEGHDGTGKSTQIEHLRQRLRRQGIDSIEFHEPQGSPIADEIRTVIKNGSLDRDGITNMLLFSAARHDIWFRRALPAMDEGVWVLASRNYYSTLAYQGYGEGIDLEIISTTTRIATDDQYLRPDIAIILDLGDEIERNKRIASRGELDNPDTFESRNDDFQSKVRRGYLDIAETHSLPVVNATQTIEQVSNEVWGIVSEHI